ncbi:SAM-dependent methyltransferase [Actinospica robiniae]|uniref:SAM-dependent methyltransferase n=1 Tax=Actinospica robiniae TaxID=304901 RepID=UPI0003FEE4A3|nr:SAM-dependent methyltransferase [Actinospica robiniae]
MGVAENRPSHGNPDPGREWRPPQPTFDLPHPLRMRDFLLGGKDNYQADRDAVEATLAVYPDLKLAFQAEQAFLRRAIAWIADPAQGLTQFLHLGAFVPTRDSYDGQVRAQCPEATFVYVTDDSISAAHARGVLAAQARPQGEVYVQLADFREPGPVLRGPWLSERLDLSRPVGVLLVGMLDFTADDERLTLALSHLRAALAPGSLIVAQHALEHPAPATSAQARRLLGHNPFQFTARPLRRVRELLAGFEFVDPGFVPCTSWRPDGEGPGAELEPRCPVAGGIARV